MLLAGPLLVAGLAGTAEGSDEDLSAGRLLVKVWDRGPVPKAQWERARRVVDEAFAAAGLQVGWLICGPEADVACSCPSAPGEVGLRIFRPLPAERRRAGHFTGGAALTTDRARGQGIAYVFLDRVEGVAKEGRLPGHLVLGTAAAHEIAHVLLPPGHSSSGIMQAHLARADWMNAAKGWLSFGPSEAAQMRQRLWGEGTSEAATRSLHPAAWTTNIN